MVLKWRRRKLGSKWNYRNIVIAAKKKHNFTKFKDLYRERWWINGKLGSDFRSNEFIGTFETTSAEIIGSKKGILTGKITKGPPTLKNDGSQSQLGKIYI